MDIKETTKAMRWQIADKLADERLEYINELCDEPVFKETLYTKYGKRFLAIVISLFALTITLPVNMFFALLTYIDIGRSIFFVQERLGKNGEIIKIIKFRNMKEIRDERGELLPPSERVTRWGEVMRKTSLDELLNFWSILKGDMSLIGPRPLVPEYENRFNKRHKMRMAVKPGLECPPRADAKEVLTWQEQFENDIWYIENISFWTDCLMILRLVKFAFNSKCANARAKGERGIFMGYDMNGVAIALENVPREYKNYVSC